MVNPITTSYPNVIIPAFRNNGNLQSLKSKFKNLKINSKLEQPRYELNSNKCNGIFMHGTSLGSIAMCLRYTNAQLIGREKANKLSKVVTGQGDNPSNERNVSIAYPQPDYDQFNFAVTSYFAFSYAKCKSIEDDFKDYDNIPVIAFGENKDSFGKEQKIFHPIGASHYMINNVQIRSLLCLNKDFDKLKSLVDKFDYNIAIVSVPDIGVLRGLSGADEASLAQTIVFNQSNFKAQLSEIFNACDINIYENEKIYEKNTPLTIDNSRKILPVFSRRNYLGYVAKDEALPRKKRTWYAEYPDLRRQYWPENLNSLIN